MSLSSIELWQRITAKQLASPMQCRSWAADAAEGLSASEALDGQRIADQLVAQQKLTSYQAEILLSGSDDPLVRHGWRILEPVQFEASPTSSRTLWTDWWVAAKSNESNAQWMRWIDSNDLNRSHIRLAQPSLPLAMRHSQVTHAKVQTVLAPEMDGKLLRVAVVPSSGQLLSGLCQSTPLSPASVIEMLLQCSAALAALHAAGLTHGRVTPDRICQTETGDWQLLRDPLCVQTLDMANQAAGLLASRLPNRTQAAHFMAPEFLSPAQPATPQTDCYALGCSAWYALTGSVPFAGNQAERILAAHAQQPLDMTQVKNLPEPLVRCLMYCLAKNPQSRFANGAQLQLSLQEVQRLLAGKPSDVSPRAAAPIGSSQPASSPSSSASRSAGPPPLPATPKTVDGAGKLAQPPAVPTPPQTTAVAPKSEPNKTQATKAKPESAKQGAPLLDTQQAAAVVPRAADRVASGTKPSEVLPAAESGSTVAPAQADPAVGPTSSTTNPAVRPAAAVRKPVTAGGRPGVRKATKKKKAGPPWLAPAIGGGALLALLLLLFVLGGGLGSKKSEPEAAKKNSGSQAKTEAGVSGPATTAAGSGDGLSGAFEIVDSSTQVLWVPPQAPSPIAIDLLPPGAQMFISVRPKQLFQSSASRQLLELLDTDLNWFWEYLRAETGLAVEDLSNVIVAAYPGTSGQPQFVLRAQVASSQSLAQLKKVWQDPSEAKEGDVSLLVAGSKAFYVANQPLLDSQTVTDFCVGPVELVRESCQMQGAVGPMSSSMEHLWQVTDRQADVSILVNPSFLFTEGRQLLTHVPPRLAEQLQQWLARDMRGALFSTSLGEQWYYESRLVGQSDRDAGAIVQRIFDRLQNAAQTMETWFVSESPHPYWRALAMRLPNMLRALAGQTRVGVENGQAICNGYLPAEAAPNLILASWLAWQPIATAGAGAAPLANTASAATPLTPEQILDKNITVVVDQQGIEVVLQLIGEQANDKLPPGTKPLKFELDGAAFQRSGITRNQQQRDFRIEGKSVRTALTELARRGNPATGVTDLTSDDQKLIWVLVGTAENGGEAMVSLTSREAAKQANRQLPAEFAPAK